MMNLLRSWKELAMFDIEEVGSGQGSEKEHNSELHSFQRIVEYKEAEGLKDRKGRNGMVELQIIIIEKSGLLIDNL